MTITAAPATATHAAPPPPVVMTQMITGGVWITQSLYVAAKLGIADLVAAGPQPVAALAEATGTHAQSLYRVLRALASVGVFAEDEAGHFGLTPLAATLQSNIPGSLRAMALLWGESWHWEAWSRFLTGVQKGTVPLVEATGQTLFEYFGAHPDHARIFEGAMTSFSGMEAAAVTGAYDFTGLDTIVDVGGGHGLLLGTILRANPARRGILFELPFMVDGADSLLRDLGVRDRCEIATGDFFQGVTPGGDAYLLKNILHDFTDEQALAILRNCRRAMAPGAKVLTIQEAIAPGNGPSFGKLIDIQMLFIGGRERTEAEYRDLYAAADLTLTRILPTGSPLNIIEGIAS